LPVLFGLPFTCRWQNHILELLGGPKSPPIRWPTFWLPDWSFFQLPFPPNTREADIYLASTDSRDAVTYSLFPWNSKTAVNPCGFPSKTGDMTVARPFASVRAVLNFGKGPSFTSVAIKISGFTDGIPCSVVFPNAQCQT